MGITEEMVISAAEELLAADKNPSMAAVRKKIGTGSFSTISPILRKWREGVETSKVVKIEIPSDIKTALDKFGNQLWTVASGIATDQLDKIREEARSVVDAANSERNEAMEEIERLEYDISALNMINLEQKQDVDDLLVRFNKSESINATINQRCEYLDESLKLTEVEIKDIKATNVSYIDKVEALLIEKSELSRVNGELNERVISCEKEFEVATLKSGDMTKVMNNMELSIRQNKVDLDEARGQLGEARIGASELNSAIAGEQQQRKFVEKQFTELKVELQISREDNNQLQAQLINQAWEKVGA
jgi:chromosome segregation ATPase